MVIQYWSELIYISVFKESMKLINYKDVKSRLLLFYNFIGISHKICICNNIKVLNFNIITNANLMWDPDEVVEQWKSRFHVLIIY